MERVINKRGKTHRESKTALYSVWDGIKQRCRNKNGKYAHIYYDRGIKICEEWATDFLAFKNWAIINGWVKGLHIDRKDNDLGYSPENCRITTAKINLNNKRDTQYYKYNGETKCATAWAEQYKTTAKLIKRRLAIGWGIEKAITTPSSMLQWHEKRKNHNYTAIVVRNIETQEEFYYESIVKFKKEVGIKALDVKDYIERDLTCKGIFKIRYA